MSPADIAAHCLHLKLVAEANSIPVERVAFRITLQETIALGVWGERNACVNVYRSPIKYMTCHGVHIMKVTEPEEYNALNRT